MSAIENMRVTPFQSEKTKSVAFVSCKIKTEGGGIYLNDMTLVNGNKGLFLSFPSRKMQKPDAQGREYRNYYFADRALREELEKRAISEYNKVSSSSGSDEDIPF